MAKNIPAGTRVWASLLSDGPQTADQIASRLGMEYDKVRSHLSSLAFKGKAQKEPARYAAVI